MCPAAALRWPFFFARVSEQLSQAVPRLMDESAPKEPWWKPAVEILGQVTTWIVVPIVAALILGKWLDGRYGTKPWIFLGLTGIGFVISTFGIVLIMGRYLRKLEKEKNGKADQTK